MGYISASTQRLAFPTIRLPQRLRFNVPHSRGLTVTAVLIGMALTVASASSILALRQTHAVERAAQAALRRQFLAGLVAAPVPLANQPVGEGQIPAPVQFVPEQPAPVPGSPVALIQIPSIDIDKVIVEGTGDSQLRRGPGHYPGTVLPGREGTFGVAGYRATYGAPFLLLDQLKAKDPIYVSTTEGRFHYQVVSRRTVEPGQNSSLLSDGEERLVLTTTAPSLRDDKRLVVTATLKSHSERGAAKVQLPAGEAGPGYPGEDPVADSFELNPLGRLAAINVTPSSPAAPPPAPAPPAPPPAAPPGPAPEAPPPAAPAAAPPADQQQNAAPAQPPPPPPPAPAPAPAPVVAPQPPSPQPPAVPSSPAGTLHRSANLFAPACRNGLDDDGDGLIDSRSLDGTRQDDGCNGEWDNDE
ncbi:MAG TPA: class E sortase [Actinomycetota bacterium]|nr:class E sortase [Actinomycetota bacterium]